MGLLTIRIFITYGGVRGGLRYNHVTRHILSISPIRRYGECCGDIDVTRDFDWCVSIARGWTVDSTRNPCNRSFFIYARRC